MELKGKVAIITGGAGGIGLSTAKLFLSEGASGIMLVDNNQEALNEAKNVLKSDLVRFMKCDVSLSEEVKAYMEKTISEFGRIDVLFLNAGIEGVVKPIVDYPEAVFDQVIGVNVKGVWLGMKHAFPHLKANGGGSVMITSSVAGLRGTAQVSAYVASKHATIGLMRVGALEGAPDQIRVNSIHPSPVDNRMMRSLEEGFAPGAGELVKENFTKMIPLGRYGTNEDMANLALFLASDKSRFITGASYVIDGGFTA
ncbi:SDR family NAD(P)-dependent oxidoreductase [Pararhodonellum marinum]|uniref:SDR family NAD(P)-dependent oxidoreductase n=1 Tax=Pararhodonellum marinum TaxID=2755358 RepID=UPI00188E9F3F|nr:glucose 1-dehydrogenase [Pararhodonellum marinum]